MLEKTKTVRLCKALDMAGNRCEQMTLREPFLAEVEQFYMMQRDKDAMAAMKLLIALVSGMSERALAAMAWTDYRCCEDYLMGFLTWSPSANGSSLPPE